METAMDQLKNGIRAEWPLPRALQKGVVTTDLGGEVVVYDSRDHRGHCLNPAAAMVWRQLDGEKSMTEVVSRLQSELDADASEDTVWLALHELDKVNLLEKPFDLPVTETISRRGLLQTMGAVVLLPAISTLVAPPAYAQASGVACSPPDSCATFTCAGGCACVPTTEGAVVCIIPTCVAPCTTTTDCPPGTVCMALGCCGPATFCVPIAPTGTNCAGPVSEPWRHQPQS
jgi:Coenzyme PQQ synthesis protein D (PqqD)